MKACFDGMRRNATARMNDLSELIDISLIEI